MPGRSVELTGDGASFVPGPFAATLLLVDRTLGRVLCGAPIRAANADEISAYTTAAMARSALAQELRTQLEGAAWDATLAARESLVGEQVPFDIVPVE
jgi:hypothetical protein